MYHFFELMILGDARHLPTLFSNRPSSVAGDQYHFFELMILGDARHLPTLSSDTSHRVVPWTLHDFLTPETPPVECRRRHVSFLRADDFRRRKTPPNSFFVPLPPSPVDDSLSLKTPPECLLVPLPPSAVDDFVTPETPPIECRQGPLPSSRVDDFSRQKTPPNSFFVPLPPSPETAPSVAGTYIIS
ncbi:nuclear pore complex-interacting protein family member B3-like [Nomascus leucogenys]|uniref:nuclear pore complex-interacting protein family member B3-like n=1 Tax=Nomascus leucogenys TaxID=61853 RepID=UPI00122D84BD|nr:nuclear pore complex-interacting protein family member B3-like [Nomascus leucogenys]